MDIATKSHWEKVNDGRMGQPQASRHQGWRTWFSIPPSREIFEQISDRFFKKDSKMKVMEIGCAPGRRLLRFAERYGYVPYGVEYTKAGVECTGEEFKLHGIPEKNCFYSDVFHPSFQEANKDKFDVVISFGFIEHFTNVEEVIDAHLNLLKPGGILLVMIPNLRGIYYLLTRWLAPDLILKHNLTIMTRRAFSRLFEPKKVKKLFEGYYGVLNMGVLHGRGRLKTLVARSLQYAQLPFNPILRYCHRLENGLTSPYLIFIGRKTHE